MSQDKSLEEKSQLFLEKNAAWHEMYKIYKAFFAEHGAVSISTKYVDEDGNMLGSWFRYQRQRLEGELLSEEAKYLLDLVNPKWHQKVPNRRAAGSRTIQWSARFELVKEFIEEFGRPVPARTQYKDENIGYWLVRQRQSLDKKSLDEMQIKQLLEIGILSLDDNGEIQWDN